MEPIKNCRAISRTSIFHFEQKPRSEHRVLLKAIAVLLVFSVSLISSAQQVPKITKREAAIKQKIDGLPTDAEITVTQLDGAKRYGRLISHGQDSFTIYEDDAKTNAIIKYAEVKKVKEGISAHRFSGNHPAVRKGLIVAAIALTVATVLVIVAAIDLRKS